MFRKCRYAALISVIILFLCLSPSAHADSVYARGSCGEAVEWTLYNSGTLVISGSGDMTDYPSQSAMPWYNALDLIRSVEIRSGVSSVGSRAFEYARQLIDVTLPDTVRTIAQEAFFGCDKLHYVNLQDGLAIIGDAAFTECSRLTAFPFPATLREIGTNAFCGCLSLSGTADIPAGVERIGAGAFERCLALCAIKVSPDNPYYADLDGVLYDKGMTQLLQCPPGYSGELTTPESLHTVSDWAFVNNSGITAVDIRGSGTVLGEGAFSNCSALERVSIACPLSENCFNGCTALHYVNLSEGIRNIPTAAFRHCVSLTEITFPSTLEAIGPMAFYNAGLFEISLGQSIRTVDYLAFAECKNLKTVYFTGDAPQMSSGTGFGSFAFDSAEAVCPCTWDEAARKNYGGSLSWSSEHSFSGEMIVQCADDPCEGIFANVCAGCGETQATGELDQKAEAASRFVVRLYRVLFDRVPDADGYVYYTNGLYNGRLTGAEAAAAFVFADEFKAKNTCDAHYVTALYRAFMGREPSEREVESWMWRLQKGDSRESVFNFFANSAEYRGICEAAGILCGESTLCGNTRQGGYCTVAGCTAHKSTDAFAQRLYEVCLDRSPDDSETAFWHYSLVHGDHTGSSAAAFFITGEEFRSHGYSDAEYVRHLYAALLGRDGSEAELEYWVYVLGGGTDRDSVLAQFLGSDEFKLICQSFQVRHH